MVLRSQLARFPEPNRRDDRLREEVPRPRRQLFQALLVTGGPVGRAASLVVDASQLLVDVGGQHRREQGAAMQTEPVTRLAWPVGNHGFQSDGCLQERVSG